MRNIGCWPLGLIALVFVGVHMPDRVAAEERAAPAQTSRSVLYLEDGSSQGLSYPGLATWRPETAAPGSKEEAESGITADISVPDRKLSVSLSFRRNRDASLPASHTIEIKSAASADLPAIISVPGMLMKPSERARGIPLTGAAAKVTTGFFIIGLSSAAADQQRNMGLLRSNPWIDVPMVLADGHRAILAVEKGPAGEQAFNEIFAASQ